MEALKNKIANADKVRVSGALEGFTVASPVKGIYTVTTRPHGGTSEWTIEEIMARIKEMMSIKNQDIQIDEFDFATNEWISLI
jgi:hypothetical protein